MDSRGRIYEDDPEKIPAADKARLDGFLWGAVKADELARLNTKVEELEEQLREEKAKNSDA